MTVWMELAENSWAHWHHRKMQSCYNGVLTRWTIAGIISNQRASQSGKFPSTISTISSFSSNSVIILKHASIRSRVRNDYNLSTPLNDFYLIESFSHCLSIGSSAQCRYSINSNIIYTVAYSHWNHYILWAIYINFECAYRCICRWICCLTA